MSITDIHISEYLEAIGRGDLIPTNADINKNYFICSPFTGEKTPSCSIKHGYFNDYSSGFKGGVIAFASLMVCGKIDMRVGARELYRVFPQYSNQNYNNQNSSYNKPATYYKNEVQHKQQPTNQSKKPTIQKVQHLYYYPLINYLLERKISLDIAKKYLHEIHYTNKGKIYKALGFKNDSDAYVLRNKYIKMNLGKNDITTIIENDVAFIILNSVTNSKKGIEEALKHSTSVIFEGFMDFLSYKMISRKKPIQGVCSLFLDNDISGDIATLEFKQNLPFTTDYRHVYNYHSDLNSFIMTPKTHDFEVRDIATYDAEEELYRVFRGDKMIVETKYKTHIKKLIKDYDNGK